MSGTTAGPDDVEMTAEEKAAIVETLAEEMHALFHEYASDQLSYADLSFEMFDTLQTLHALVSGDIVIEYEEDDQDDVLTEQPSGRQQRKGGRRNGH